MNTKQKWEATKRFTPSPLINKLIRFNIKPKVPGTYSVNSPMKSTGRGTRVSAEGSVTRNLSSGYHVPRFFR